MRQTAAEVRGHLSPGSAAGSVLQGVLSFQNLLLPPTVLPTIHELDLFMSVLLPVHVSSCGSV